MWLRPIDEGALDDDCDAIHAAVDFGFGSLDLPRIFGFTDEHNQRSLAAFERPRSWELNQSDPPGS